MNLPSILPRVRIVLSQGGYLITGSVFTYVEEKDLLKKSGENCWKGPCVIEAKTDRKYICQNEVVLVHFGFNERFKEKMEILEGFSSKKDRDNEELYVQYVQKYVKNGGETSDAV